MSQIRNESKEAVVGNIGKMYRDCALRTYMSEAHVAEAPGAYISQTIKDRIDDILQTLRLEYAIIIQREFLEEACGNWFEKYFEEEEYRMYKKGAIDAFLRCLYG